MKYDTERLGYEYGVKDEVLDALNAIPGADALHLDTVTRPQAEMYLGTLRMADLATYQDGNVTANLRAVVSVPAAETLYGLVGVSVQGGESLVVYGLSRFASSREEAATWHGPVTRHVATIQPEGAHAERRADLPWLVSLTPGTTADEVMISYRGDEFVDIIGAPRSDEQIPFDIAPELWCPDPTSLIEQVKPV